MANDARIEIVGYRVDPVMIEEDENNKSSGQGLTAAPTPAVALPSSGMPAKSEAKAEGFMMEVTISGSALAIQDFLTEWGDHCRLRWWRMWLLHEVRRLSKNREKYLR